MATWSGELCGWRALADFTQPPPNGPDWIPDPKLRSFTGVVGRVVVLETIWTQRRLQVVRNFA